MLVIVVCSGVACWITFQTTSNDIGNSGLGIPGPEDNETTASAGMAEPLYNNIEGYNLQKGLVEGHANFAKRLLSLDPQPEQELVDGFFDSWLKADPIAATKAALDFPGRFQLNQSRIFTMEFHRLLQTKPDLAVEMLIVSNGRLGDLLLFRGHDRILQDPVLEALNTPPNFVALKMSKEEFAAKMRGVASSGAARKLVGQYATFLADRFSFEELTGWTETLDAEIRKGALQSLFFAVENRSEVLNYLASAPSEIRQDVGIHYVVATSEHDPQASIEWLSENAGVFSVNPNFSVLSRWLMANPEAAKNYARSLVNPQRRELAATAVAQTLAKNSVEESFTWIKEWSGDRREMLESTISYAIQFGSEGIGNYLRTYPNQTFSREILEAVRSQIPKEIGRNRVLMERVIAEAPH